MAGCRIWSRRDVLRLAAGAAGAGALGALARLAGAAADPHDGDREFRLRRPGRSADQLGRRPPPGQTGPLRPVIALHGKGSSAATVMAGGSSADWPRPSMPVCHRSRWLLSDGGSYWHRRASGEDAGAMVLDELLPMLSGQGLDTSRVGFMGLVDGGYGALLLGGRLGPGAPLRSARSARRSGCHRVRPPRAPSTAPTTSRPTACSVCRHWGRYRCRIDCGYGDPFYAATKGLRGPSYPAGRWVLSRRARRRLGRPAPADRLGSRRCDRLSRSENLHPVQGRIGCSRRHRRHPPHAPASRLVWSPLRGTRARRRGPGATADSGDQHQPVQPARTAQP